MPGPGTAGASRRAPARVAAGLDASAPLDTGDAAVSFP